MPDPALQNSIVATLERLDEIRPFNQVANRIVAACNDPDSDAVSLSEIIRCDPTVSLRVMHVANSSLYGSAGQIRSVEHAIVVMGFRAIRNLCLSVVASELFDAGDACAAEARQRLWQHSLYCGSVASCLGDEFDLDRDEAFLAGVVHDIGKLIFFDAEHEEYGRLSAESNPRRIVEDEVNSFGIDHQEIGRRCAEQWSLPCEIRAAICAHHVPETADEHRMLVNVICAADALSHAWQDTDEENDEVDLSVLLEPSTLELSREKCDAIKTQVESEFDSLMGFLSSGNA